jgi:RNA polymerase sigma factor (sigma-70 family)
MNEQDWLAERFEQHRTRLRAVSYRMLGSLSEADDAVQEAWLRLSSADTSRVDDLGAWLTTVVARICLNALRSRAARREEPLGPHLPDPILSAADTVDPEDEALIADSVGLALLIVLDSLAPAERLAFVLHDVFDLPFEQIARSSTAQSPPRDSSPAARAAVSVRQPRPTRTSPRNGNSSTRSSLPPATATSTRSSPSSTPTSCSASTPARQARAGRASYEGRKPSPRGRSTSTAWGTTRAARSSTAHPAWSRSPAKSPTQCSDSPSHTTGSSR